MKVSGRLKSVAKISSGTIIGQLVSILTLPVVTRLYGAEIIGSWTAIYAIASIVVYCCDLGLSQALMIESDDQVEKLYQMISTLSLLICVPAFLISVGYYLLNGHNFGDSLIYAGFAILYAYTLRQVQTCYTWLNRDKQYNILMRNPVINYAAVAVFSICLGLLGFKQYGYYWGVILGQFLTLVNMKMNLPKKMFCFDMEYYRTMLQKHRDFVKYQMPAQISTQLRQQLPNLLISSLFGNTILGYFSISQKLISIPITFIGQALGKVFYQTAAEMQRQGKNVAVFLQRNMNRAIMVAAIPMILFTAYGDAAIVLFFGKEYALGGVISRIIVFRALFTFLSTSLAGIDIVSGQQKTTLQTCLAQTVLACASVIVGFYVSESIIVTTWLIVITFDLLQIWYFCKIYKAVGAFPVQYIKSITAVIVVVAGGSVLARFLFIWLANVLPIPLLTYLLGCLVQ